MANWLSLIFPVLSGIFFVIGFAIVKVVKNKKSLAIVSVSMAFVVMVGIIFLDLIPEIISLSEDVTNNNKLFTIILAIGGGVLVLKILDFLIPSHNHIHHDHEKNYNEHKNHAFHMGFVMSFSLILHNIIEGISIYILSLENFPSGFLLSMAVGLHNLPLSIEISGNLEQGNKKMNFLLSIILCFSCFFGAFLLAIFNVSISNTLLFILLGVSLGMILYIALFELLKEVFNYRNKKEIFYGLIIGIMILLFMSFID